MDLQNHKPDQNCSYCFGFMGNQGMVCIKCAAGCCFSCSQNKTKVFCRCRKYFPRYLPTYRCAPVQPALETAQNPPRRSNAESTVKNLTPDS